MTSELPRLFMILVLLAFIVGLLIWARGDDHHHGDDVGAQNAQPSVAVGLEV